MLLVMSVTISRVSLVREYLQVAAHHHIAEAAGWGCSIVLGVLDLEAYPPVAEHRVEVKAGQDILEGDLLGSLEEAVLGNPEAADPDSLAGEAGSDKAAVPVPGSPVGEVGRRTAGVDIAAAADPDILEEAVRVEHIDLAVAVPEAPDIGPEGFDLEEGTAPGEAGREERHTGLAAVASIAVGQAGIDLGCEIGRPVREVAVGNPDSSRFEGAGHQIARREVAEDSCCRRV